VDCGRWEWESSRAHKSADSQCQNWKQLVCDLVVVSCCSGLEHTRNGGAGLPGNDDEATHRRRESPGGGGGDLQSVAKRPHDHSSGYVGNNDITVTAQAISILIICITNSSSEQSAEYAQGNATCFVARVIKDPRYYSLSQFLSLKKDGVQGTFRV
jgi:hypothetical protein